MTVDAAPEGQAIDPHTVAQQELSANTVPTPDDVLQDVGPLTALWYARETAYYAMQIYSATLSADLGDEIPDDSEPVRALAALSTACGELDGACALVSLLPPNYGDSATA